MSKRRTHDTEREGARRARYVAASEGEAVNVLLPIPIWFYLAIILGVGYAGYCIGYIRGVNRRSERSNP